MVPTAKINNKIKWGYNISGSGENLIFLHGWGVNRNIWRQQIKYFLKKYTVLSIDLPGHGESSWEKISLDQMGESLAQLVKQLNITKAITVSSSLGGLFSLKLYERMPDMFRRMIFVGSIPKFVKSEGYPFGLDVAEIRKLCSQLDTAYPSIVNIFFRSLFTKEERSSRRYRWLQRFRQEDSIAMKPALAEYLDILEKEDLRDLLKGIDLPLQFINGDQDTICNQEAVLYLKELCPHARFDFFKNCGHFPFLSKPHEFNEVLDYFLSQG